jgi:hypothetical protein
MNPCLSIGRTDSSFRVVFESLTPSSFLVKAARGGGITVGAGPSRRRLPPRIDAAQAGPAGGPGLLLCQRRAQCAFASCPAATMSGEAGTGQIATARRKRRRAGWGSFNFKFDPWGRVAESASRLPGPGHCAAAAQAQARAVTRAVRTVGSDCDSDGQNFYGKSESSRAVRRYRLLNRRPKLSSLNS